MEPFFLLLLPNSLAACPAATKLKTIDKNAQINFLIFVPLIRNGRDVKGEKTWP